MRQTKRGNRVKYALPVAIAALAASEPAASAVDMFLKIDGVPGESVDDKHAGEIDVLAWSWNISQSSDLAAGGGAGAARPQLRDLKVIKYADAATAALTSNALVGRVSPTATLTIETDGPTPFVFLVIDMEDVMISRIAQGGSAGEDRLTESISLNYSKISITYTQQNADGSKGPVKSACFDVAANVEC